MKKLACYMLVACMSVVSFCLLVGLAALTTVGPIPGYNYIGREFGGHYWLVDPTSSGVRIAYDHWSVSVPISRWHLILLGLSVPTLVCVSCTGVLFWFVFRVNRRKT